MATLRIGLPLLLVASTSFALPRPNSKVRAGANHHLGDDSFVANHQHRPDRVRSELERDRMHEHLAFVRDWLASRPATRPELEKRRGEILAYFDSYIAKYTTPKNDHVPWRTPVFIDDEGTICAVGYLIQQSVNPELPKKIASSHRYDFIEDIAKDLPEVAAWVEGSGFTLEEIASIQPAYSEPNANTWRTWNLAKYKPKDGAYDKLDSRGRFEHGMMEGEWIAYEKPYNATEETITGRGTMKHGSGAWTSFYDDGKKLGEGRYANNRAEGPWKLYHPSGNLAAEGSFSRGDRAGKWKFYYDTADKTPIAIGRFGGVGGQVEGRWKHFDATGALLATSWTETPDQWHDTDWNVDGGEGFMLDIVARPGEVKHVSHRGTVNSESLALDMYALGGERIYVDSAYNSEFTYDQNGYKLEHVDGAWRAADCGWSAKKKAYAHAGDLVPLHGALYSAARLRVKPRHEGVGGGDHDDDTGPVCRAPVAVSAARAARLDALVAEREKVRALTPQFVRKAVLHEEDDTPAEDQSDSEKARIAEASDLTRVLASNMAMYVEWPHIDGKFEQLYGGMAGRVTWRWTDGDPEAREQ